MEMLALEGRPASDLTCTSLLLDRLGWERIIKAIDTQFVCLFEEQENAKLRIFHSGEQPIRVSILQFAFESPMGGDGPNRTQPCGKPCGVSYSLSGPPLKSFRR